MNGKSTAAVFAAACLVLASVDGTADDGSFAAVWSTGIEYSTGTYGGDEDIEELYIPVGINLNFPRVSLDLTVPYLSVRGPAGTATSGPGGQTSPGSGETVTESGLGDIIAGITVFDVAYSEELGLSFDLAARVKFGTADPDKGLGTGEEDFTLRADLYKFFDQFTLLGSVGYKYRGDPDGVDLKNVILASAGGFYYPSERHSIGLFYDYRESALEDTEAISELSAYVTTKINDNWLLQLYVFTGFSESSSDWGGGLLVILG